MSNIFKKYCLLNKFIYISIGATHLLVSLSTIKLTLTFTGQVIVKNFMPKSHLSPKPLVIFEQKK